MTWVWDELTRSFVFPTMFRFIFNEHILHIIDLPDSVCHPVRSESPHKDEFLERTLVFPFLREFLFLWTLWLHHFLPAFGRTLDVPVQTTELIGEAHCLQEDTRSVSVDNLQRLFYRTWLKVWKCSISWRKITMDTKRTGQDSKCSCNTAPGL